MSIVLRWTCDENRTRGGKIMCSLGVLLFPFNSQYLKSTWILFFPFASSIGIINSALGNFKHLLCKFSEDSGIYFLDMKSFAYDIVHIFWQGICYILMEGKPVLVLLPLLLLVTSSLYHTPELERMFDVSINYQIYPYNHFWSLVLWISYL